MAQPVTSEQQHPSPKKGSAVKWVAVAVVVVIVIAGAAILLNRPSTSKVPPPTISVSTSTQLATAGQPVVYTASTTGNVTAINWTLGDGSNAAGGRVTHTYSSPGKYLIFANASGRGGYANNLENMMVVTVSGANQQNITYTSEISQPVLAFNSSQNPNAPIVNASQLMSFDESYLQPTTAYGWTLGYYIINYGDGTSIQITPIQYNTNTGSYSPAVSGHTYAASGFYPVNLTIVTYNTSSFSNDIVVNNATGNEYLPSSYYTQVLGSPEHFATSYVTTVYVASEFQKAATLKASGTVPNPGTITVADVSTPPYSLDPAVDYDWPGPGIFSNVYEQLLAFNGSSTTNFVPIIASQIPTVANGGISSNLLNYTFNIRSGIKFSNGDTLNAWDVYTTYVRTLLFMLGSPTTPGWLLGMDLLPLGGFAAGLFSNGTALFDNITSAITYSNSSQTVTFHLLQTDSAFFQILAYPGPNSILDYNWLVSHGAGITFSSSGFLTYTQYSVQTNYNTYIEYNVMGSGPYEVQSYLQGQSMAMVPNPNFTPLKGVTGYNKTPTNKIDLLYLKEAQTAVEMMQSSQADITQGLPPSDYPTAQGLQSKGMLNIYTFNTLVPYFFAFNWNINVSMLKSTFGSQFTVPQYYFANQYVRQAFAYSFNYTNYIDNIIGNKVYGANFSSAYAGLIIKGIPDYTPPGQLQNVPEYNLTLARQFMMDSGLYNTTVNIPVIVWTGDTVTYAGVAMWASNITKMDPNVQLTPVYLPFPTLFGYIVPGEDPVPIFEASYSADYPYPSDLLTENYLPWGYYPIGLGWNTSTLNTLGYINESKDVQNLTNLVLAGNAATNKTEAFANWTAAEQLAINMTVYVYSSQANGIWYFAPWISGVQFEENPMINGMGVIIFSYLSKG